MTGPLKVAISEASNNNLPARFTFKTTLGSSLVHAAAHAGHCPPLLCDKRWRRTHTEAVVFIFSLGFT